MCFKESLHVWPCGVGVIASYMYINILLYVNRQDSNKEVHEIGAANYAVLERIRVNRREDHLKVS